MNRYNLSLLFFVLFLFGFGLFTYVSMPKAKIQEKKEVVKLIALPDLAISTEAHSIRHRSLTDLFEIFGMGPSLLPYFPSEFLYAPAPYINACEEFK